MAKEYRINVYDDDNNVVARVRYNQNLDFWDGRNWSCGALGRHKGLTKLKDGRYVLIHGSDYEGERDYGEIISPQRALQEILKSGNTELLKLKKFKELKELYDKTMVDEELDDAEDVDG